MSTVERSERQDYDCWAKVVDLAASFHELLQWARATLPCAPIPCCCVDATCARCCVERVIAQADALEDNQGEAGARPTRPLGMPCAPVPKAGQPTGADESPGDSECCRWLRWNPPSWSILETRPRPGVVVHYWAKMINGAAGLAALELTAIWEPSFRRTVPLQGPEGRLPLEAALRSVNLL